MEPGCSWDQASEVSMAASHVAQMSGGRRRPEVVKSILEHHQVPRQDNARLSRQRIGRNNTRPDHASLSCAFCHIICLQVRGRGRDPSWPEREATAPTYTIGRQKGPPCAASYLGMPTNPVRWVIQHWFLARVKENSPAIIQARCLAKMPSGRGVSIAGSGGMSPFGQLGLDVWMIAATSASEGYETAMSQDQHLHNSKYQHKSGERSLPSDMV